MTQSSAVGKQTPSYSFFPTITASDATDAIELSEAYGLTPDPFQRFVLELWKARRADGKLASSRVGLSVPRQNGKNGALEASELFDILVLGRKVLHTAHETKTSQQAFRRLASFFRPEVNPDLARQVEQIRQVNGQEAIVLRNGGEIRFIARTKNSGRGFTADTLVLDEAQELNMEALGALLPAISSGPAGDPQQIYLGTPPGPTNDGEIFTKLRNDGHEATDPRLSWIEWSADRGCDLDDAEQWAQANPALGTRLMWDVVYDERAALDDETFARERLGMWSTEESARVIPQADWEACAEPNMRDAGGEVAIAVDISPARSTASIAAAGLTVDGAPWVDVIETRHGTPDWLLERIVAICGRQPVRAVLIDGKGPAASLIDPLKRRKIKVSITTGYNMAAAAADFYDAVLSHRLVHLDQPALNVAVASARKRRLGDAWAWNRKDVESDITPLVSATLALFGQSYSDVVRPTPRKTRRKVIVL